MNGAIMFGVILNIENTVAIEVLYCKSEVFFIGKTKLIHRISISKRFFRSYIFRVVCYIIVEEKSFPS